MAIKSVKVWKNTQKTETRIYVHTDDNREGCWYRTGNPWHAKNSRDGALTDADWAEAKKLAVWDNCWHTVYASDRPAAGRSEDVREEMDEYARFCARQNRQSRYGDQAGLEERALGL